MKFWYSPIADVVIARIDDEDRLNEYKTNARLKNFNIEILTSDFDIEEHNQDSSGAGVPAIIGVEYLFVTQLRSYGTVTKQGSEYVFVNGV